MNNMNSKTDCRQKVETLTVNSRTETHDTHSWLEQICLRSETQYECFFLFYSLIFNLMIEIASIFSLKYFCRCNLSPEAFLKSLKRSRRSSSKFSTQPKMDADIYLADFVKKNLVIKFAVIWVKNGQMEERRRKEKKQWLQSWFL